MTIRTTTRDVCTIARALRNGEDFTTSGALKGEATPYWIDSGRMAQDDANALRTAKYAPGIHYVVYSYGTPIAYLVKSGGWVVPDAKYSATTSKHQTTVRRALRLVGMS